MASGWPKSAPPATEGSEARLTCDLRLKMMEFARDSIYQIYPIYPIYRSIISVKSRVWDRLHTRSCRRRRSSHATDWHPLRPPPEAENIESSEAITTQDGWAFHWAARLAVKRGKWWKCGRPQNCIFFAILIATLRTANETGKLVHQSCPDGILQRSSHGWGPLVYLRGDRDRPLQAKSWLGKNHPLHFQIGFPIGLTTRITTFFW